MKKFIALIITCFTLNGQAQDTPAKPFIQKETVDRIVIQLKQSSEPTQHSRIERGVNQAASFWNMQDGTELDFENLCHTYSTKTTDEREALFFRMETNLEMLMGSFNKMSVGLKMPLHVDKGEILPVDYIFGGYSPGAHFSADFYANKLAFITILNFPFYTLDEKNSLGDDWSRREWAYARLGDLFKSRVPASLLQDYSQIVTNADGYISQYNIYMGNLRDLRGRTWFPKNMKLISHWGLRDELKASYAGKDGFNKQAIIYEVMLRIIRQEIPSKIINNDKFEWNPYNNTLLDKGKSIAFDREPDTRYQYLLDLFNATKAIDAFSPHFPNYISRKFDDEMEISVNDVENIFIELISSEEIAQIAQIIEQRLGRKLQPWDIWYDGFKTRSTLDISKLDQLIREKYPNSNAFEADIQNILITLGFHPDSAFSIASKITVDPSRGAGHAWGAAMKSDKARLRTRIPSNGMDYKGYNIAIHELGHNVEQTITLQNVDYYMMNGVPNTAFTEALAFIFQARDLAILGMDQKDDNAKHLNALNNLWSNYEIMGVSLVDINVWRWLYANPNADAVQLKDAVNLIAKQIWNQYYAPVFGIRDSPILAIYSHMIDYPLYLSAYPIGQLIEFQFGKHIADKDFASEVYRSFTQGKTTPQYWMKNAVGREISPKPAIEAAAEAIKVIRK